MTLVRPELASADRPSGEVPNWTLLGREETLGGTTFIVRSCPFCQLEGYADAEHIVGLDALREWALAHPARCLALPPHDRGRDRARGHQVERDTAPTLEAVSP